MRLIHRGLIVGAAIGLSVILFGLGGTLVPSGTSAIAGGEGASSTGRLSRTDDRDITLVAQWSLAHAAEDYGGRLVRA